MVSLPFHNNIALPDLYSFVMARMPVQVTFSMANYENPAAMRYPNCCFLTYKWGRLRRAQAPLQKGFAVGALPLVN
jgi:hypothetical protein